MQGVGSSADPFPLLALPLPHLFKSCCMRLLNQLIYACYALFFFKLLLLVVIFSLEGLTTANGQLYYNFLGHPASLLVYFHTLYKCQDELLHRWAVEDKAQ